MEVIVGEFSLATDNCAMWLNGFNDNLPGYPVVDCAWVRCPPPYMGDEQPGCPPDEAKAEQGPFGTGMSTPRCAYPRPRARAAAATELGGKARPVRLLHPQLCAAIFGCVTSRPPFRFAAPAPPLAAMAGARSTGRGRTTTRQRAGSRSRS